MYSGYIDENGGYINCIYEKESIEYGSKIIIYIIYILYLIDENGVEDEMFFMEDEELSSCCSSMTYHSISPCRDSPEARLVHIKIHLKQG